MSAWLIAAALTVVGPSMAGAQAAPGGLAAGNELFARGEIEPALAHFEAMWRSGVEDPSELALVHLRIGTIRAIMGASEDASRHFRLARAIDPRLAAPPELGPAQRSLFDAAGESNPGFALSIEGTAAGSAVVIQVTASPGLQAAADEVRVSVAGDAPRVGSAAEGLSLRVDASRFEGAGAVTIEAWALDANGGSLTRAQREIAPPEVATVATPREAAADASPDAGVALGAPTTGGGDVTESPWFWVVGVLTVLAIGGGVAIGLAVGLGEDVYDFGAPTVVR